MDTIVTKSSDLQFAQIGWIVKDIEVAKRFFKEAVGINNFSKTEITRLKEFKATYYGEPSNAENLVSMAYTNSAFIELIQPLYGDSVFKDYLDKNPSGGVQHVAFSVPIQQLDKVTSDLIGKGYPVISTFDTPIAYIIFFDTVKDIGVVTEIMGITAEGEKSIEKMKNKTN